jgi:hypothetical protein
MYWAAFVRRRKHSRFPFSSEGVFICASHHHREISAIDGRSLRDLKFGRQYWNFGAKLSFASLFVFATAPVSPFWRSERLPKLPRSRFWKAESAFNPISIVGA